MTGASSIESRVEFSIVIGRVSTEDSDRILETLRALRGQEGGHRYEVKLGDRLDDDLSERIRAEHPEVEMIRCPAGTTLPELRARALERARGELVLVTEDHCVPPSDWLASVARAFAAAPEGTVAVGGCVENGVTDTALDWATFLCEYSGFLPPVEEGVSTLLPGMNVAYRRAALEGLEPELLTRGFWETTVHPVLVERNQGLFSTNAIRIFHCKKFSFRLFASQRFVYSRYYAGIRFSRHQVGWRALACLASLALPPLLLYRMVKQVLAKRRFGRELATALPALTLFVGIWAIGEMAGYLLGPGDALARIE